MNAPLNIDIVQILLHMLNLVILAGGLTLILYRPVSAFLRRRREHFESLEKETAEKAGECGKLRAEYEEKLENAEKMYEERIQSAQREAADAAGRYIAEAKEKADAIIRSAEDEAESRKKHILESAQTEIGELVLSAAQKLLADTANPETDSALYDRFISTVDAPEQKGDGNE